MFDMFKYSAACAAVQAGIGRLLSDGTWQELLSAKDVDGFLSVAAATAYGPALAELGGNDIKAIEKRLRSNLADRFRLPIAFLHGKARELIDWLWRPFEISNLLIALRGLHNRMPAARIRASLVRLGPAASVDWNALSNAGSASGAIARIGTTLTGRFYARAIDNAYHEYQRQSRIFVLEVALYLAYYRRLREMVEHLSGRDRKEAERYIGTLIDSRNILWAYRYHIFFRFQPETILGYTLPRSGRVNASIIQWAATGAPLPELLHQVWGDGLPDMDRIEDRPIREAVVELEVIFRRHLYRLAQQTLTTLPLHLGTILAYLVLLESEVEDLIATLEGVAYRWPSERVCTCLIGNRGRA